MINMEAKDITEIFMGSECDLCGDTGKIAVSDPVDADMDLVDCPLCVEEGRIVDKQ